MILAFDTYYFDNKAKTVCLSFEDWTASEDFKVHSEILEEIEDYTSTIISIFFYNEKQDIEKLKLNLQLDILNTNKQTA